MTTIGEYIKDRKEENPHLNVDKEVHARAMRKTGHKTELQNEKSLRRKQISVARKMK